MKTTAEWATQLRQYIAVCRVAAPLPGRDTLTAAEEERCRIVGGSMVSWFRKYGPSFLQERAMMAKLLEIDREPSIVFTSDIPGLVAAQEIVGQDNEQVAFLLEEEYAAMAAPLADPTYRHHVHFWSFFPLVVEPEIEAKAKIKYPIQEGHIYWQHSEGTMWAINAGRGVDHLWQWDGQNPELLAEAISHWVS